MNSLLQRRIAAVLLFIAAAIAILLPFASATLLTIALGGGCLCRRHWPIIASWR